MARMLSFCAGAGTLLLFTELPSLGLLLVLGIAALLMLVRLLRQGTRYRRWATQQTRRICLLAAIALLGFCHAHWQAKLQLQSRLPIALDGCEFRVSGRVSGIVVQQRGEQFGRERSRQRFDFRVESIAPLTGGARPACNGDFKLPKYLRLSNYSAARLASGERWRLHVRLRSPRGSANFGGFDMPRFVLSAGIDAYGYLRERYPAELLDQSAIGSLRLARHQVLQPLLARTQSPQVFNALLLGDKSALPEALRTLFIDTGTAHLMAISGLHIGIAAGWGAVIGKLLLSRFPALQLSWPRPVLLFFFALPSALFYASLSGFAVSTQRALAMLLLAGFAILRGTGASGSALLGAAAFVILLVEPLAVLNGGFWLSFTAVLALLLAARRQHHRNGLENGKHQGNAATLIRRSIAAVFLLLQAQAVLFIAMPAVQLAIGLPAPAIAPLANFFAVPIVSLWVIPLGLAALLCSYLHDAVAIWLLLAADAGLQLTLFLLVQLQHSGIAAWRIDGELGIGAAIAAAFASVILLGRLRAAFTGVAALLWVALFIVPIIAEKNYAVDLQRGDYALLQLDIGQGTSVLIRTRHSNWLFDTGGTFGFGRDAGNGTILPALRKLRVQRLDGVILSHADRDHTGGARSLQAGVDIQRWFTGGRAAQVVGLQDRAIPCEAGMQWQRDGVQFSFLNTPDSGPAMDASENAASCVLAIRPVEAASAALHSGRSLLTGDIEWASEMAMLAHSETRQQLPADVLMVPHHGSKTSSSESFLDTVAPRVALVSAGFGNRYGHPNDAVMARYRSRRIAILRSDLHGAVSLQYSGGSWQPPRCARQPVLHFWDYREPAVTCSF
ncbi:MAG: DNA internalization-related competence protein ComEC/Rec2 [Pseudomonadales bacterium]